MGAQLSISDSCGVSDPFLLGVYTHVNKCISKEAQPFMPDPGLGYLSQRRVKAQTIPSDVPVRWEGPHTEAPGCGGVCEFC